jgi:DNA-binding PadR family transcriptional regulator
MSNTSKNFDLREVFADVLNQVKERAMDFGQSRSAAQPTSDQIEIAVLATLSETPKNAADVVAALALTSAGIWAPTVGKIHPVLTTLTEAKKVSAKTEGDRKVYAITKTGKAALKEAAANPVTESASTRPSGPSANLLNCDATFLKSASKLGPVMLDVAQTGTREQQQAAAAVLDEMRHKLHGILAGK